MLTFLKELQTTVLSMSAALRDGRISQVVSFWHKIKGGAHLIGAPRIELMAMTMESDLRQRYDLMFQMPASAAAAVRCSREEKQSNRRALRQLLEEARRFEAALPDPTDDDSSSGGTGDSDGSPQA